VVRWSRPRPVFILLFFLGFRLFMNLAVPSGEKAGPSGLFVSSVGHESKSASDRPYGNLPTEWVEFVYEEQGIICGAVRIRERI